MSLAQISRMGQQARNVQQQRRKANPLKYFVQDVGSEIGRVARDIKPISNILAPAVGTLLQGVPRVGTFISKPGEDIVRNIGQRLGLGKKSGGRKKKSPKPAGGKRTKKSGGRRKPGRPKGSGKKSTGGKKKTGGKVSQTSLKSLPSAMRIMAPGSRMLRPMIVY